MKIAVVGAAGKMGARHFNLLGDAGHEVIGFEVDYQGNDSPSMEAEIAKGFDAAVIASPTPKHYHHAEMFLRKGVPVLIEKPGVIYPFEMANLLAYRIPVAVGFLERFSPAWKRGIEAWYNADLIVAERYNGAVSPEYGNVAIDLASHDIDLIHHLFGGTAMFTTVDRHWDSATFSYVRVNGKSGKVHALRQDGPFMYRQWSAYGEVSAVCDFMTEDLWIGGKRVTIEPVNKLVEQHKAFFDLIAGKRSFIATGEQTLATLRVIK